MPYRHLLLAHFLLVNVVAAGFAGAGYVQGWMDPIIDAPLLELSGVIVGVFLYGTALALWKVWRTSRELNDLQAGHAAPGSPAHTYLTARRAGSAADAENAAQVLRLTLSNRIVVVRHFANSLVFLGLIGTVIGFVIALSGVDPSSAGDANKAGAMVATLIEGMAVALNTTLIGSILYVWLIVNHRILATGTVNLLTAALALPAPALQDTRQAAE